MCYFLTFIICTQIEGFYFFCDGSECVEGIASSVRDNEGARAKDVRRNLT